jgi:hypothetical protein
VSEAPRTTRYRVVVRGRLTQRLASAFDGLTIEPGKGCTALSGCHLDQAALHGVLDRLRALGIELESVSAIR